MSDFDQHFQQIYGPRWKPLKEALLQPSVKAGRSCFQGYATYHLDPASIVAASALPVQAGEVVLDLCAAPGGKALILAENLFQNDNGQSELIANELSFARKKRLQEVIRTHVPDAYLSQIKITSWDATQVGIRAPGRFDKILLDAPCSSERHLLSQDPEMREWKVSRTKQLAMRQYALLCSALLALKPGGLMVYSTCSISPLENDGAIERLLERKGDSVEYVPHANTYEKTKYGTQIFPDQFTGQGPIYFSVLRKKII